MARRTRRRRKLRLPQFLSRAGKTALFMVAIVAIGAA